MSQRPSVECALLSPLRLFIPVLGTILTLAGGTGSARAAGLRTTVEFAAEDFRVVGSGDAVRVRLGDAPVVGGRDHPELPMVEVRFYVPDGQAVGAVSVRARDETVVAEGLHLSKTEGSIDRAPAGRAFPSGAVMMAGTHLPARRGVSLGGGNLGGFRVHSVAVFPLQWNRVTGDVTLARSLDVEFDLVAPPPQDDGIRLRANPAADAIFRKALAGYVVNPADLPAQERSLRSPGGGSSGFAPEELPSVEGSGVDMVIIASAALGPHFQPLADWKTKKGVPTVIRTVEWIEANYPAGRDQPERVRNFLRDAYRKWGTYLVLLGGEDDIVEPRMAWDTFFWGGREIPSDQYFACLDGDWNGDGDHLWGEGVTLTAPGDSVDLYPDIFVGRASTVDSVEVATFVAKSMTYDKSPPAGYVEDHGGLGEVLFPSDWEFGIDPATSIALDGKGLIADSLDAHVPVTWTRSMRYQSDNNEDRTIALSELNFGHHVLSIMGHGDAFKFSVGNGTSPLIQVSDTDVLTNGDRLTVVVATACNPNEFDLECQGESFLNNPNGGAVAVFGPSREDFPISASSFHANMYRMFFERGITGFGAANQLCRVRFVPRSQSDTGSDRWTMLTKMLLGDPELHLWTKEPGALTVSHVASQPLGVSQLTVTVTDSLASPVAGALVCVSDSAGTYSRQLTDAAGQATLAISSTQAGTADVVVTARDFLPDEGTFTIDPAAGAHLASTAHSVDDDGTGPSSGNGDGVIDAGETIELGVTVLNGGAVTADSVTVNGSIEAGGSATFDFLYGGAADPAKVFVGPGRVNPGTLPFTLDFGSPAIAYVGAPLVSFTPDTLAAAVAGDAGIFVWQDREGWHVQWGAGVDSVGVSGTITTDGRIRSAHSISLDSGLDSFAVSVAEDSLTFSSTVFELNHSSGLDFTMADSTMVTLTASSSALGSIGASATAVGTLVLDVSSSARIGQIAYVDVVMTAAGGGPWQGEVPLFFAGPDLEAYVFAVQDSGGVLSGDGDGVIEQGETVRLTPTVINRGDGAAVAVAGAAVAVSGITFVDAADSYGDIGSLGESAGTDGYVFTVNDSTGRTIDLTLTDTLGRTWAKTMDFVAPAQADSLWFTSTSTSIDVAWAVVDSIGMLNTGDIAGWNLYRSATAGSGHVKQNFELLRSGSGYTDSGLSLGSMLYYLVAAVDSSGNEGPLSPELTAWTTQVQVGGWPRLTNGFIYPGVAMGDTDRNGNSEIYIGSHDTDFYAWDHDADERPGFPVLTSFEIWGTASLADLDEDGDDEILFGGRDSRLYAVHHGGSPFLGANQYIADLPGAGDDIRTPVVVADIDHDSDLEILVGTDLGTLYAFNADGTGLVDSTGLLFTAPPGDLTARIWGTIAVADLDKDGNREIVFGSWNDSLYVIDTSGNVMPGFPRAGLDDFRGGPVVGDLDNDGTMEIVAGNFDGNLYVFNHDGTDYLPGGIMATYGDKIGAGAALANVDGDPELEIFIGGFDGTLYAYNHDGSSFLPGTGGVFVAIDATDKISASPIVVDVDGDSDFEVFIGHRNGNFYGFHLDGTGVTGLPIPTGNQIFSTAAAGDIDNDGDVDVAFASYDASVNVLDFDGASTAAAYEWPTYGGSNFRTSAYGEAVPYQTGVLESVPAVYRLALAQNRPNPFASGTTIRYVVPRDQRVTLKVFNIAGRLVRTLVNGSAPAGPNVVRWDGTDSGGKRLSSGMYFYRLNNGEKTITRKGVLLR